MKLSSTPKPVRIRISLGGIEHTTLESLKENITPEILDFTDGRLQRWLEKLGEDDLADKIGKISNTECRDKRLLYVYNAIFEKDCTTIAEYLDEWCKDKAYYKSAKGILFWKKDDIHYVKGVFNQCPNFLDDNEWVELADLYNDHDFSYIIGKKLLEKGDVERAKKIIKAVVKDNSEAESFYKTHFKERSIFKSLSDDKLESIAENWKYTQLRVSDGNKTEDAIYRFIRDCKMLVATKDQSSRVSFCKSSIGYAPSKDVFEEKTHRVFLNLVKAITKSDILVNEKLCIVALVNKMSCDTTGTNIADRACDFIEKQYPFKKRIEKFNCSEKVFKEFITDIFRYILLEKFKE